MMSARRKSTDAQKVGEFQPTGTAEDMETLVTIVDALPVNIIVVDPATGQITYANRGTITTLNTLRSHLPSGFNIERPVGGSFDIFDSPTSDQRSIIRDPANLPHSAKIKLGPETIDLRVSAAHDRSGKYVGAVVSWSIVTGLTDSIARFETGVKATVDQLASSASEMRSTAEEMSGSASDASSQVSGAAAGAEQASANVQTVASATEELATSVREIARQVGQASEIAGGAVIEAERTNEIVQGLALAAERIGNVVGLIQDIASQTNLLALNATIEAARAGEAGKGFAVVASEVKTLANQTAKATEDITEQISAIQQSTTHAVNAIQGISGTIQKINQISSAISAAVEEQGAATSEISRNVQEAATGTQDVSQSIARVSSAVSQTQSSSKTVMSASETIALQADELTQDVERFVTEIKTH